MTILVNPFRFAAPVDGYLLLPGGASNYADTPDHADFDILTDIDLQVELIMDDWTPGAIQSIVTKSTSGNRSYELEMQTNGRPQLRHTADGSTMINTPATAATGFTDGSRHWLRATMDVDDGSGNRVVKFYTSSPGASPSWTQLGSTVTTAGTTSIFSGGAIVALGSRGGSAQFATGKLYRLNLRNGYDGAGTLKSAVDLTGFVGAGSTYTDPEGHVWTERGTANFVAAA